MTLHFQALLPWYFIHCDRVDHKSQVNSTGLIRAVTLASITCLFLFNAKVWAQKPLLQLANTYRGGIAVDAFLVSEKLDGVRARYTQGQLVSRSGNVFAAPSWFTQNWPQRELDGELWLGRGQFAETLSIVSRDEPHIGWQAVYFMVFDLADSKLPFEQRVTELRRLIKATPSPYLRLIEQHSLNSEQQLYARLNQVIDNGGEGLMLHKKSALYQLGRTDNIVKLKPVDNAQAVVIAHNPGKGKFTHLMGSIRVRNQQGIEFNLGSGFSLELRRHPPAIGSTISYRFYGLTKRGKPRFASFLSVISD
ncbi:DNA ligase [Thalassotalea ponticola]|uniref:DNA ligase n=1 Tax=Thalassotalea ponticola TaxID=1523392 RepID=UPI0025B51452|nr:DNA ligase [Thalassotalea ponticola]MDN3652005.1 DNA ligase [Thalassotalea ponticola]